MHFRKILPIILGATLLIAGLVGLSYQVVRAQAPTPTPATSDQTAAPKKAGQLGWRLGFKGGVTQEELANTLGISVGQLQTAEQTATQDALAQAVSQGLITQSQADRLSNGRFGSGMGMFEANGIDYNALLAKALGISAEELQTAQQSAFKTAVDNAVKDGKVTQDQADLILGRQVLANDSSFQSSMQSAFKAAVQKAVSDGVITQAQADQILKNNQGMGLPGQGWLSKPREMGRPGFGLGRQGGKVQPTPPTGSSGAGSNGSSNGSTSKL